MIRRVQTNDIFPLQADIGFQPSCEGSRKGVYFIVRETLPRFGIDCNSFIGGEGQSGVPGLVEESW